MTIPHQISTIHPIYEESSEDENTMLRRTKDEDNLNETTRRQSRSWFETNMPSKKSSGKDKDKEKSRKHRSATTTTTKSQSKEKSKNTTTKRSHGGDRDGQNSPRHRRRSTSSTSSGEEDEEPQHDHRMVLATKTRLTSPSTLSHFTTQTNKTNKSSGSSGSNNTITQSSLIRRSTALVRRPEPDEEPMSPAVPDAPDVFAYLEAASVLDVAIASGSESESESEEDEDEEDEEQAKVQQHQRPQWSRSNSKSALVHSLPQSPHGHGSSSSSTSSSFHGEDDFAPHPADVDTDRSTSPERSVKDHDSDHDDLASDAVSVKIASQMAAAQQRQHLHALASPSLQRLNTSTPHTPSAMLTPRHSSYPPQPPYAPQHQHPLSPGRLPTTGYESLAMKLSIHDADSEGGAPIKPIYRKFEALNHRVLLYTQDELVELEEALQRIDRADTEARRLERTIVPASRRAGAQQGGELEWHRADVMAKIAYKLGQYNQALSSFNKTQSLSPADPEDVSNYRTYLQTEQPIAEEETHFLDPTDDLVSVYSEPPHMRAPRSSHSPSYAPSTYSVDERPSAHSTFPPSTSPSPNLGLEQSVLPGLAAAIAASVVVPILTFSVIDKFLGRLVVTLLVAVGVVGALMQSGILARGALFGQEAITCAAIYGGVMIIMAGII